MEADAHNARGSGPAARRVGTAAPVLALQTQAHQRQFGGQEQAAPSGRIAAAAAARRISAVSSASAPS